MAPLGNKSQGDCDNQNYFCRRMAPPQLLINNSDLYCLCSNHKNIFLYSPNDAPFCVKNNSGCHNPRKICSLKEPFKVLYHKVISGPLLYSIIFNCICQFFLVEKLKSIIRKSKPGLYIEELWSKPTLFNDNITIISFPRNRNLLRGRLSGKCTLPFHFFQMWFVNPLVVCSLWY